MKTKKVELNIPKEFKEEPLFYNIIKKFNVIPNIIEASFSTEMGWAIVEFKGTNDELEKLFEFLKEKNIDIKFL